MQEALSVSQGLMSLGLEALSVDGVCTRKKKGKGRGEREDGRERVRM